MAAEIDSNHNTCTIHVSVIEIVTFVREAIVAVKNGRRSTLGQILILSTTELNS